MTKQDLDIKIKGARVHNLKNVHVNIPYNQLTVVTGVSGSGKSSLTMDTLFAEGQRRYVESLSSYARQFMKSMQKPDVDTIEGLCPAIAIDQKVSARTPRSTVGSMTEINDYLRLLFAKAGRTYSPLSGREVKKDEVKDVIAFIQTLTLDTKIHVIIPLPAEISKNLNYYLDDLLHKGFTRLYHATAKRYIAIEALLSGEESIDLQHCYVLVDRLVAKQFEEDELHRVADSIQTAFDETNGDVYLDIEQQEMVHFCNRFEADGIRFEEPSPNFFSSNNPYGACPECEGFGTVIGLDENLVIPNKNLSVYEGAVVCWNGEKMNQWKVDFIHRHAKRFPVHKPIKNLSAEEYDILWNSAGGIHAFFEMVQENVYKIQYRVLQSRYRGKANCPACKGSRLRKDALYVKINDTNIATLFDRPVERLYEWVKNIQLNEHDQTIAKRILYELQIRLKTLLDVGLNYLTLNRTANTLSGGESQRIQLTRVIGSNLSDSLYILDEPSIGLHARDTHRLIGVLKQLRDLGNTVVVVEHDEHIMRECDHIIDMGPLASHLGGEVIAEGSYRQIMKSKKSLTAKYLHGQMKVGDPNRKPRKIVNKITLTHCDVHNLKNITVSFPLNMLTVLTGVSGSGKTSLIKHILYPALRNVFGDFAVKPGSFGELKGDLQAIESVEMVDQNPIGKSSRSNPISYIKAYDDIRALFSAQRLSKVRGYAPGFFSFNVDGGRCDNCKGEGETTIEMQFLADVHLPCEVCKGKRFKQEVLEVQYKGKNIAEILDMSVDDAWEHFADQKKIADKIKCLQDVGLGYIKLGQSSDTLSGGEAQRVKLASFLDKSFIGKKILFIFDEPTTGLHFHDIHKLLASFQALIENGHSIIVIEHNSDIIRNADHIIDLGPEGGEGGGEVIFTGTYEGLLQCSKSYTAQYL